MDRRWVYGLVTALALAAPIGYRCTNIDKAEQAVSIDRIVVSLEDQVDVVARNGTTAEIVFLGQYHADDIGETKTEETTIRENNKIAQLLYDKHGVHSILIEHFGEEALGYNKGKVLSFHGRREDRELVGEQIQLLTSRRWLLYSGGNEAMRKRALEEEKPILDIKDTFVREMNDRGNMILSKYTRKDKNGWYLPQSDADEFKNAMAQMQNDLRAQAREALIMLLDQKKMETLFKIKYSERERVIISEAIKCRAEGKLPLLIIYGYGHTLSVSQQLEEEGFSYVALKPKKIKERPTKGIDALRQNYFDFFSGGTIQIPPVR